MPTFALLGRQARAQSVLLWASRHTAKQDSFEGRPGSSAAVSVALRPRLHGHVVIVVRTVANRESHARTAQSVSS